MVSTRSFCERQTGLSFARISFFLLVLTSFLSLIYRVNGYPIFPSYIPLLLCALAVLLSILKKGKIKSPRIEDVAVILIGTLPLLLSIFARDQVAAREQSLIFLYFSFTYFTSKALLNLGAVRSQNLINSFSLAFFIILSIGFLQAVTGTSVGLIANYFGSSGSEGAAYQDNFRVSATMTSPNVFANCLVFLLPTAIYTVFRKFAKSVAVIIAFIIISLSLFLVINSGSRAGFIYFFVSIFAGYIIWLKRGYNIKNRWLSLFIVCAAVPPLFFATSSLFASNAGMISRFMDTSDSGRLSTYLAALSIINDPKTLAVGVGVGHFFDEVYYRDLSISYKEWMDPRDIGSTVHNWVLQVISEIGIITFIAWISFVIVIFRKSLFAFRHDADNLFFWIGVNFFLLFLLPLQLDTSIGNPSILSVIALSGAMISQRSHTLKISS